MISRTIFGTEHEIFRNNVKRFIESEILPHHRHWEEQQCVDRNIWKRAGELGMLCMTMPEEFGGMHADRLFSVVMIEELSKAGATGIGFYLHSDIVANYINNFGSAEQKLNWLPKMATGDVITAIAMTEPGAGSDLQAIKTTATPIDDHYVLNGSKTFITNGYMADLVVVVARTGTSGSGAKDLSLLLVEANSPGFTKGKPLKKIGMKAQDTCELFFDDVKVPKANLLGSEGGGFLALMRELAWERIIIATTAVASAEQAVAHTRQYTQNRKVFGKNVSEYQNTRFRLAEMAAEIAVGRAYLDKCLELVLRNELDPESAAIAKYWTTEMQGKILDQCLQLHGGYGFMSEYPVARAWVDARVQRIYGGTNEIMKEIIARAM